MGDGRWEQVSGRAAAANRSEYYQNGQSVIEFSVCHNREGEAIWYTAIAKNDCATLATTEVEKGTRVTIAGKVMDKGSTDKTTGKWRSRFIMFLERLAVDGGGEASDSNAGLTAVGLTHASSSPEELAAYRAAEERTYPLRWHRPGWAATAGGQEFFGSHPDALKEAESYARGVASPAEVGEVSPEEIRAMLISLGV